MVSYSLKLNISIDFENAEVKKNGKRIALTTREFRLLCFLVRNPDRLHSRDDLLNEVWGYDAMINTRTVDVHIASLRQKLEHIPHHPVHIQTIHGMGYRFNQ